MFEMTLSEAKAKSKVITFIIGKLRGVVKNAKGIMVCEEYDQRICLAIAVRKDKKDFLLGVIFDAVCEAIIRFYKEDYLLSHIELKFADQVASAAFVKALTMFDKAGDKEIIRKHLLPCSELNIDSLYHFRLWELESRWADIARLVCDNSPYLSHQATFFELMRFLILTSETEVGEINLFFKGQQVIATGKDGSELFNKSYSSDDKSKISVVSELICLSPEKIVLFCDKFDCELKDFIASLFAGKVEFNQNCVDKTVKR